MRKSYRVNVFRSSDQSRASTMQSNVNDQEISQTIEESKTLVYSNLEKNFFSPKCVIFCLELRKICKKKHLRYIKFAFFLIRSLYKDSQLETRRRNCYSVTPHLDSKNPFEEENFPNFRQKTEIHKKNV